MTGTLIFLCVNVSFILARLSEIGWTAAVKAVRASSISICPPATKPDNASASVPATFAGYAFEEASFPYYAGNASHPNLFSRNLLNTISNKTGATPVIRVGGTSL